MLNQDLQEQSPPFNNETLARVLELEKNLRKLESFKEFCFYVVNQTHHTVEYEQGIFIELEGKTPSIQSISGLMEIDVRSNFSVWLIDVFKYLMQSDSALKIQPIDYTKLPANLSEQWPEFFPSFGVWVPIKDAHDRLLGVLLLGRNKQFNIAEAEILEVISDAYAHTYLLFKHHKKSIKAKVFSKLKSKIFIFLSLLAVVGVQFLPLRQNVLAPIEIVPKGATIVSSPADGVISKFYVQPNQKVKKGDLLFEMDETNMRNQEEVAMKALSVAKVEYESAEKRAFSDPDAKSELKVLMARINEKKAELKYAQDMRSKSKIKADHDGVAVFNDEEDFIGKPVNVGQKIMQIANPQEIHLEMWLPVDQAIFLPNEAEIVAFLNIDPLNPIHGSLVYQSYEARPTPAGVLAYRLRAELKEDQKIPRIGLEGTAKIYGEKKTVFEYIMRRPLVVIRKTLGI